jgi:hypothetical protein
VLRIPIRERIVFSINGVGKIWIPTCRRIKLDSYFLPFTIINSKYIKDLKIDLKLRRKHGEMLQDIKMSNDFMDKTPKAQEIKAKIGKLGIKL